MVRTVWRRLALGSALLTAVAALLLGGQPAQAASSEDTGPKATKLILSGHDRDDEITVTPDDGPELFAAMWSQVNWLSGDHGRSKAPMKEKLGPKYTLLVLINDKEKFSYELYPLAEGGPRAYRPAKQPGGKTTAAWFFGRLNMPYTLRLAGLPLPEQSDVMTGGIGGGERINAQELLDPTADIDRFLDELRQMLLLNGAVLLVITLGLAGISYLVRRRV